MYTWKCHEPIRLQVYMVEGRKVYKIYPVSKVFETKISQDPPTGSGRLRADFFSVCRNGHGFILDNIYNHAKSI